MNIENFMDNKKLNNPVQTNFHKISLSKDYLGEKNELVLDMISTYGFCICQNYSEISWIISAVQLLKKEKNLSCLRFRMNRLMSYTAITVSKGHVLFLCNFRLFL